MSSMNEVRVQSILAGIEGALAESRTLVARGELALTLARKLDDGTAGPSTAAVARELRLVIGELEQVTPDAGESLLEDLNLRRKLRRLGMLEEYERRLAESDDEYLGVSRGRRNRR